MPHEAELIKNIRDRIYESAYLALPTESAGLSMLPLPEREEVWVRRLFERAVGGFYDVTLGDQGWHVRRGGTLSWPIEWKSDGIEAIMPNMRTDVVLDHAASGRRIVIDTKFTSIVSDGWHREQTLRSGYIYQIYAYLRSQVGQGDVLADHACGVLLHPAIDLMLSETVKMQGHLVMFATVDLAGSSAQIRQQLMALPRPPPHASTC